MGSSHDVAPSTRRRFVAGVASLPLAWGAARWLAPAAAAQDVEIDIDLDYDGTPVPPARDGLQDLIDGNKRYVAGELTAFVAELVASQPDVIVTWSTAAVMGVGRATAAIPVVVAMDGSPDRHGWAVSYSNGMWPTANITGLADISSRIGSARPAAGGACEPGWPDQLPR